MANKVEIIIEGVDRASSVFGRIGSALGRIAFTAAAAGIALIGKTLTDSVKSAIESENAMAGLNAVLASTKGVAGLTIEALTSHAAALQQVTTFSDETINSSQRMLLTFTNIGKSVFPRATEASLNMAEVFGSVEAAAMQIGKALQSPIEGVAALRRVGVRLSDEQEKQVKAFMAVNDVASAQGIILGELDTEFGGLARAMGKTTSGQMTIFMNQIDNLKEQLGTALLPILVKATAAFTEFINSADFKRFWDALTAGDWSSISTQISEVLQGLSDSFANIDWAAVSTNIIAGIDSVDWASVGTAMNAGLDTAWTYVSTNFMAVVNETDWSGLYQSGTLALLNFLAGLTDQGSWYNVVAVWTSNINQMIIAMDNAVPMIAASLRAWIVEIQITLKSFGVVFYTRAAAWVQQAINAIAGLGPNLIAAVIQLMATLKSLIKPISLSISLPNFETLAQQAADGMAMLAIALSGGGFKGGVSKNVAKKKPAPGGLAAGGPVSANTPYIVGEVGQELFIPSQNGSIIPNNKLGGSTVINLTYAPMFSTVDKYELQDKLRPFIESGIRQYRSALA